MNIQATKLLASAFVFAAFIPLTTLAQPAIEKTHYSHGELRQLMQEAHTSQQYQALATYFRLQEKLFNDKANVEKEEWERRRTITVGPTVKYPTPADSARNLYQYYAYKADEMATHANNYKRRAQ